jgi:hypothetical protein
MRPVLRRWMVVGLLVLLAGGGYGAASASTSGVLAHGPAARPTNSSSGTISTTSSPSTSLPSSSDDVLSCGANFFSSTDEASLTQSFGPSQACMFLVAANTWVDLVSATYQSPSPGGAVLLVDTCAVADLSCSDPSSQHYLSSFTAYPLPDSSAINVQVFQYLDSKDVIIPDGACRAIMFNLATDLFYQDTSEPVPSPVASPASFLANQAAPSAPPVEAWCAGRPGGAQ